MPTLSPVRIHVQTRKHGVQTMDVSPVWVGRCLAVTPPATSDGAPVQRGRWTLTHVQTGMSAVSALSISKRGAIALARKWDQRFAMLDPAATRDWPHLKAWQETVRAIREPWTVTLVDDDGDGHGIALSMAADRGLSVDPDGGAAPRILWRRQWWFAPTDAELQAWTMDSVCDTPDGRTVEPDAPDSWLRILGLV